ncbi:hypothetical protein Tco_1105788 [Tanacetum coccineum]
MTGGSASVKGLGSRDVHSRLGQRRSPSESSPSSDSEDSRRKRRKKQMFDVSCREIERRVCRRSRCPRVFWDVLVTLSCQRVACAIDCTRRADNGRTFTHGERAPLSKPAVDIATAQPITDADAPVIVFMSVQVLQVSRLIQSRPLQCEVVSQLGTLVSKGWGWRLGVFVPGTVWGGVVKVARCRPSMLVIVAVVWVVPRDGPIAMKTRSYGALVALLLRLRSPLAQMSEASHSVPIWALDARIDVAMAHNTNGLASMITCNCRNMVQTRQPTNPPDVAEIIAQQLQNIIPNIVTQVTNNLNNANGNGNGGGNNGCTYKGFVACGPRDFNETGGAVALTK